MTTYQATLDSWAIASRSLNITNDQPTSQTTLPQPTTDQVTYYQTQTSSNSTLDTNIIQSASSAPTATLYRQPRRRATNGKPHRKRIRMTPQVLASHNGTHLTNYDPTPAPTTIPTNRLQTYITPNQESVKLTPQLSNNKGWGHALGKKHPTSVRIAFRNISSLPIFLPNSKHDELIQDITTSKFDITGIAETNVCWPNIPVAFQPYQRFKNEFEHVHTTYAYNSHNISICSNKQTGGTLMLSTNHLCHRVTSSGRDPAKLGRWTWVAYRGADNKCIRILTLYRPVKSSNVGGTYIQQQTQLLEENNDTCPRLQLLIDLEKLLAGWYDDNDLIVVMGDFNEFVLSCELTTFFNKFDMVEVVTSLHDSVPPNTYANGHCAIDGIFASTRIRPVATGYTPVNWGTNTDHRCLWADLNFNDLFGTADPPLWKPQARRLKMDDPRIVTKFNRLRLKHSRSTGILAQIQALRHKANNGFPIEETYSALNEIDQLRMEGINIADHGCRKLYMGAIQWTPQLQQTIWTIQYLRESIAAITGKRNVNARTLLKLRKRAAISTIVTDEQQALCQLQEQFQLFKQIKRTSTAARTSYLDGLATAKAVAYGTSHARIILDLKQREHIRSVFRKIKAATSSCRTGLTTVETTDATTGAIITHTDKKDIEQACMKENTRRFTQAYQTPSLQPDQIKLLGWTGQTPISQDILNGNEIDTCGLLHPGLKRLAPFLTISEKMRQLGHISTSLTREDFRWHWKRCKEFTSCGRSGLHFGHFKSSALNDHLTDIDRMILEISMTHGIILRRWLQAIDVMIPKKANSCHVTKLRTIMLFEADWNYMNKIVGKRIMQHAERGHNIAPEQYGSRKKKSAILHATNKQLLFDIIRQKKVNVVLLILDATACYDCVSIPVASICLQRQGAPQPVVKIMFETLAEMLHYIRTSFGDSAMHYAKDNLRFHGIGQGNGAGPTIWVMVSSPLLERLRAEDCGIKIPSSVTTEIKHFTAFTFVDDNDMLQEIQEASSLQTVTQKSLDIWVDSLTTTGGSISAEKSLWSPLVHKWHNNRWTIDTKAAKNDSITIDTPQQNGIALTRLNPSDAAPALGIMFSPSGQMRSQYDFVLKKCKLWSHKIKQSHLNREEAFTALTLTIWKTVEYGLLATALTEKQCDRIVSSILVAGLPKSGICRNIPRTPLFSTTKFNGFGLHHPYFTQGFRKLKQLLDPTDSTLQFLMNEGFSQMAIESGLGSLFLQHDPSGFLPIITKGWMSCLWEFCYRLRLKVHPPTIHFLPKSYPEDTPIMTVLRNHTTPHELQTLNYCRLYLQVTNLSEIMSLSGLHIRKPSWNGDRSPVRLTQYQWPVQPKPSKSAWSLWKTILQRAFNTTNSGKLSHQFKITSFNKDKWIWHYSTDDNLLYEYHLASIRVWHRDPTHRLSSRRPRFINTSTSTTGIPRSAKPCTIIQNAHNVVLESIIDPLVMDQHPTQQLTSFPVLSTFINKFTTGSINMLKTAFLNNELCIVSDGSSKDGTGAGAWIITSPTCYPEHSVRGDIPSPGSARGQDSHRAECVGILGALYCLHGLLRTWQVDQGQVTFGCDNISALRYSFDLPSYPMITGSNPDFDILQSIRRTLLPELNYKWRHVRGHQDTTGKVLDFWEQLNVEADHAATVRRSNQIGNIANYSLPNDSWQLELPTGRVFKDLHTILYETWSLEPMRKFWCNRRGWSSDTFDLIAWDTLQAAGRKVGTQKRHWMLKHSIGFCGTNEVLKKWKQRDDDKCISCGAIETTTHVWKCPDHDVKLIWTAALLELDNWMEKQNTLPELRTTIINALESWSQDIPFQLQHCPYQHQQTTIGWDFLIEGFLPTKWVEAQHQHYMSSNRLESGKRWATALILKLWNVAWDLWEHRNHITHRANLLQETKQIDSIVEKLLLQGPPSYDLGNLFSENEQQKLIVATTAYKQAWIAIVGAHGNRQKRKSHSGLRQMQQTLRQFLIPK